MNPGGVLTALVTPYDEAGEVAADVLARHVDRLAECRMYADLGVRYVAAVLAGAEGVVYGLSNVLPQAFVRLLRAVRSSDTATALAMQHVINTLHAIVRSTGKGVAAIRVALSQMELGTRFLRSREFSLGTDLDGAVRDAVESATRLYERSR